MVKILWRRIELENRYASALHLASSSHLVALIEANLVLWMRLLNSGLLLQTSLGVLRKVQKVVRKASAYLTWHTVFVGFLPQTLKNRGSAGVKV